MRVLGLDGKYKKISFFQNKSPDDDSMYKSKYHLLARNIIRGIFGDQIYEEVHIPGEGFYLDFFLPGRKIIVEVNGQQHYTQNNFFHKDKSDFLKQKRNDKKKKEFAEINGFSFVELAFNESEEEWKNKLLKF
jgi:very-short-patch-repair endonuclease